MAFWFVAQRDNANFAWFRLATPRACDARNHVFNRGRCPKNGDEIPHRLYRAVPAVATFDKQALGRNKREQGSGLHMGLPADGLK